MHREVELANVIFRSHRRALLWGWTAGAVALVYCLVLTDRSIAKGKSSSEALHNYPFLFHVRFGGTLRLGFASVYKVAERFWDHALHGGRKQAINDILRNERMLLVPPEGSPLTKYYKQPESIIGVGDASWFYIWLPARLQ